MGTIDVVLLARQPIVRRQNMRVYTGTQSCAIRDEEVGQVNRADARAARTAVGAPRDHYRGQEGQRRRQKCSIGSSAGAHHDVRQRQQSAGVNSSVFCVCAGC